MIIIRFVFFRKVIFYEITFDQILPGYEQRCLLMIKKCPV